MYNCSENFTLKLTSWEEIWEESLLRNGSIGKITWKGLWEKLKRWIETLLRKRSLGSTTVMGTIWGETAGTKNELLNWIKTERYSR